MQRRNYGTDPGWLWEGDTVDAFEYDDIVRDRAGSGKPYLQFINKTTMSLGLYALPAGGVDPQSPHAEDEIYYVVSGRGTIEVAGERRSVQPGSIIYVARDVEHRFLDITEDLSILVFFAPEHRTA
jgi:mannose-6-phosphate isomerase-like protein (cupin superfamily)